MRECSVRKVCLEDAFATFTESWSPRIVGDVNDVQVKIARFVGPFDWHHHEAQDEMFLVIDGRLRMRLKTGDIDLEAGELIVVPHGVEHCPEALTAECKVLLVEPKETLNTGDKVTERTRRELERLDG